MIVLLTVASLQLALGLLKVTDSRGGLFLVKLMQEDIY